MGNDNIFRVILIDDHADAREGMRDIIEMNEEFVVVAEGRNGKEAVRLTEELLPDLILMDINMPEMDGLEATRLIKAKFPQVKIIIVTVSDDITHLFEALKKGAQGYLLKNLQPSAWHEYLQAIAIDEVPMSRELAFKLLQEFPREVQTKSKQSTLTGREQEILEWVAQGQTNREIAESLQISENTIKNHLKNIMMKLHLQNRVQLTRYAFEQGWI
ncbi:response regulator transcription factor [Paenibacillus sp. HB172176]|uniref:response regulator n=1 Tax=Paenibacillus sp. HB172176 TaxID=2493690 RepID=UPI001439B7D8|nr:response regulator transcription factor [Paenibacillus sp. HB172176]